MKNRIFLFISKRYLHTTITNYWNIRKYPKLDLSYYLNKDKLQEIEDNISKRKGVGNIQLINQLNAKLKQLSRDDPSYEKVEADFYAECLKIPNKTHQDVVHEDQPRIVNNINTRRIFNYKPFDIHEISKRLNIVRTEHTGNVTGSRSYFVQGQLAELESALVNYTLDALRCNKFEIVTVPDLLHRDIIESCGLNTRGDRSQVYSLDEVQDSNLCLSGTSEMSLGGYFMNTVLSKDQLPIKMATVSRCFRAETSTLAEEKGIYRVHEFTKVEMFVLCKPDQSDEVLESLREFEENHFGALGLCLQTLDMPPHELGAPAYRKYDVEAWMPGREMFGEVSSCSNCTDYQSRRLNIKYLDGNVEEYVHTLNGTACAIPRMLIAIVETNQNNNGTINIPEVLRKYMNGKESFTRQKRIPELRLVKNLKEK